MPICLSFIFVLMPALRLCTVSLSISNNQEMLYENPAESSGSLNFGILQKLFEETTRRHPALSDIRRNCNYTLEGIRLVRAEYLRANGGFLPSFVSPKVCWDSCRSLVLKLYNFDISSCGYHPEWFTESCMNLTTKAEFVVLVPEAKKLEVKRNCNESLKNSFQSDICTNSLLSLRESIRSRKNGDASGCTGYIFIYTAALINQFGLTDLAIVQCLFNLQFSPTMKQKRHTLLILCALIGCAVGCLGAVIVVCFLRQRRKKIVKAKKGIAEIEEFCTIGIHNLVKFQYEEIKLATNGFSRGNIIGKGKYGNVYRGTLQDGTKVAIKRLKNCSIGGNETFEHELEVIASVRHFNLVALRGYCTTSAPMDGHQRLIVCDLMPNGSLYDHLFESETKLSWPIRQKIAFGTARGLAYLHNEAQASVIHRDVKSSNILLDENFDPKMADFGLAKFRPEGMTHLSTMLAGTLGYVAPEYALFGRLTNGSDVYSFGVVLLELLSGKNAVLSMDKGKTSLLSDWAWSLVAQGRALDVVEENMPDVGLPDVMEQYVVVAVLCCHPQLYARPTMDHLVKLLETNMQVSDS